MDVDSKEETTTECTQQNDEGDSGCSNTVTKRRKEDRVSGTVKWRSSSRESNSRETCKIWSTGGKKAQQWMVKNKIRSCKTGISKWGGSRGHNEKQQKKTSRKRYERNCSKYGFIAVSVTQNKSKHIRISKPITKTNLVQRIRKKQGGGGGGGGGDF